MGFIEDADKTVKKYVSNYIKWPDIPVGKNAEIKMRILDEAPLKRVFHWFDKKPLVCLGWDNCPACAAREAAKLAGVAKEDLPYRFDVKYLVNVLSYAGDEPEVKILAFSLKTIGTKLNEFQNRYGDWRTYDIAVIKTRTGAHMFSIEFDVIFEDERDVNKRRKLSDAENSLVEGKFDLNLENVKVTPQEMTAVMNGETIDSRDVNDVRTQAKKLMDKFGFTPVEFETTMETMTPDKAQSIVETLSQK